MPVILRFEVLIYKSIKKGKEIPVKFISRKMTPTEQRYNTVSKEFLAIKYMPYKLRKYVFGRKFKFIH